MAGRSDSSASRMAIAPVRLAAWFMAAMKQRGGQMKRAARRPPDPYRQTLRLWLLAAVAEELQQEHEQVDEVEVELQGAHDRLAAGDQHVVAREIHLLDALR